MNMERRWDGISSVFVISWLSIRHFCRAKGGLSPDKMATHKEKKKVHTISASRWLESCVFVRQKIFSNKATLQIVWGTRKKSQQQQSECWVGRFSLLFCCVYYLFHLMIHKKLFFFFSSLTANATRYTRKKHSLRASVKRWRRRLLTKFSSQLPGTQHFQPNIRLYRAMDPRKHSTHTRNSQFYREKLFSSSTLQRKSFLCAVGKVGNRKKSTGRSLRSSTLTKVRGFRGSLNFRLPKSQQKWDFCVNFFPLFLSFESEIRSSS